MEVPFNMYIAIILNNSSLYSLTNLDISLNYFTLYYLFYYRLYPFYLTKYLVEKPLSLSTIYLLIRYLISKLIILS